MNVPFRGQRTLSDDTQIFLLRIRPGWGRGIVILIAAASVLWTLFASKLDDPNPTRSVAITLVVLIAAITLVVTTVRSAIRREASTDLAKALVEGQLTEEGLESRTPFGQSNLPWNQFRQVKTTPNLLVLVHVNQFLVGLPRRFFANDEDWQSARALATAKVKTKPNLAPPLQKVLYAGYAVVAVLFLWTVYRAEPSRERPVDPEETEHSEEDIAKESTVPAERAATANDPTPPLVPDVETEEGRSAANIGPEGVLTVGGDITKPELIEDARPIYSREARAERTRGPILIEAIIDRDGRVCRARFLPQSQTNLVAQANLEAVRKRQYRPAMRRGQPVAVEMVISVNVGSQ
jgi:TonB family protein